MAFGKLNFKLFSDHAPADLTGGTPPRPLNFPSWYFRTKNLKKNLTKCNSIIRFSPVKIASIMMWDFLLNLFSFLFCFQSIFYFFSFFCCMFKFSNFENFQIFWVRHFRFRYLLWALKFLRLFNTSTFTYLLWRILNILFQVFLLIETKSLS